MTVTPDAVEAAAEAIYRLHDFPLHTRKPWAEMVASKDRANQERVRRDRDYARAALAAAAPLIAQQTLLGLAAEAHHLPTDPDLLAGTLTARAATLTPKEK